MNRTSAAACLWVGAAIAVGSLTLTAQERSPDAIVREADSLMSRLQYEDALLSYRAAQSASDSAVRIRAGAGVMNAMLKLGQFADAERQGAEVAARDPLQAGAIAVHGDAMWSAGLFTDAEARYDAALKLDPDNPIALHGRGRSYAAQWRAPEALADLTRAVAADPRQASYHYTLAMIYEEQHDFLRAADTLAKYLLLLPSRDESNLTKWAQTREQFLRSFGTREPYELVNKDEVLTIPYRVDDGRLLVDGVVNGRTPVSFALDTGTDQTILTPVIASKASVVPAATLQSAGVGVIGYGYRGLEIARINSLQIGKLHMRNVPTVIKSPSLVGLPRPEGAAFSPLALGYSVVVDPQKRILTLSRRLPEASYSTRLPLRMQRLPMVRARVNGGMSATLAVDTAGDGTAISHHIARQIDPTTPPADRIRARVFGSAGWDPTAFLLPFVDIELANGVGLNDRSIVVLNLDAPSGLLGFNLGGILGQDFLQNYVVSLDMTRREFGLQPIK